MKKFKKVKILDLSISVLSLGETIKEIISWININKGGVIYCCTLNEVVMASEDVRIRRILVNGDILTPDGMPLVWDLRLKGFKIAQRVYGPELLEKFLLVNKAKIKCLFIGGLKNKKYFSKFGKYLVLPYKDEFDNRDYKEMVEIIENSQAKIIWIGLGAKKQIIVANELLKRLPGRVYVTVGAAFDFLSGYKKQAPRWLRQIGGEWIFRCIQEPNRLIKRYLKIIWFLLKNTKIFEVKR